MLFAPHGAWLHMHTFELAAHVAVAPVRWLLGGAFAWKVALALHFLLAGVAAHLLAARLGASPREALLTGFTLQTSTYLTVQAQAISLLAVGPAFLLAWAAIGCWQQPTRRRRGLLPGLAAVLLLYSSLYYLFFGGLLLAVAGAVVAWSVRPAAAWWRGAIVQALIAAAVVAPFLAIQLAGSARARGQLDAVDGYPRWVQVRGSAEVGQFLLPAWVRHLTPGGAIPPEPWAMFMPPMRAISFAVPLSIVALAVLGWRTRRRHHPEVRLGLLAALVAAVFIALGPEVKFLTTLDPADVPFEEVGGEPPRWQGWSVPSPYAAISQLPVWRHIRWSARVGYFALACLLLLVAPAAAAGIDRLTAPGMPLAGRARLGTVLVLLLIAAEQRLPVYTTHPRVHDAALAVLRDDPRPGGVRPYPDRGYVVQGMAMYHQTLHHRPLFGGYLSRDLPGYDRWIEARPWERHFHALVGGRDRPLDPAARAAILTAAAEDGLGFLTVHKTLFVGGREELFLAAIKRDRLGTVLHDDPDLAIVALAAAGQD